MAPNRDKLRGSSAIGGKYGAMNPDTLTDGLVEEQTSSTQVVIPEGSFVPQEDGTWTAGNVHLTAVGLVVTGDVTNAQWLQIGSFLHRMQGSLQWLIGDWVNGCQHIWGETYQQIVEDTGYEIGTVYNAAYVAARFEVSRRRETLSFTHHQDVASKSMDEQDEWLEKAAVNRWSSAKLRSEIRKATLAADSPTLLESGTPNKKLRRTFNKIWRNSTNIDAISLDDLDALRKWLDAIEKAKRG